MDDNKTNNDYYDEKVDYNPMTPDEKRRFIILSGIMVRKVREAQGLTVRETAERAKQIANVGKDKDELEAESSFFRPLLDWENGYKLPRMVSREAVAMALLLDPNQVLVDSPEGLKIRETTNAAQFLSEYNALSDSTKELVRVMVQSEYNLDKVANGEILRPKDIIPKWFMEPDNEQTGIVTKPSIKERNDARGRNLQNARRAIKLSVREAAQLMEDFVKVNDERISNNDKRAVIDYKPLRPTSLHAYEQGVRAMNDKTAESIAAAFTYYCEENGLPYSFTPFSIKTGINEDSRLKVEYELPESTTSVMKLWSKLPDDTKTRVYADVHTFRVYEELRAKGGLVKNTEPYVKKAAPLGGYMKEEDVPTGDEEE